MSDYVEWSLESIIAYEINRALDRIDGALMFADALGAAPWQRDLFVRACGRWPSGRAEAAARRIAADLTDAGHAEGWLLPAHRFEWGSE